MTIKMDWKVIFVAGFLLAAVVLTVLDGRISGLDLGVIQVEIPTAAVQIAQSLSTSAPQVTATSPSAILAPTPATLSSAPQISESTLATAHIERPQDGESITESEIVTSGEIVGLRPGERVFLCVKGLSKIYPQGEIIPDSNGYWMVGQTTYRTPGYPYETFVVVTSNLDSANQLADSRSKGSGIDDLPEDTFIISKSVVVTLK